MPKYRSATTTHGRNMAGARALWRATGVKDEDFGKPIIAVVNSFTQFVPGTYTLKIWANLLLKRLKRQAASQKNSIPSPSMMASQWVTAACFTRCHHVN